jgi:HEAT repeat protein
MALRDRGREASPALDGLVAALRDDDANVRLMSGNALAGLGPEAAPAVAAITAACAVEGEQVHVLRSCASALGAIGKAASPALPALRALVGLPRVQWAAEAAIRAIETAPR